MRRFFSFLTFSSLALSSLWTAAASDHWAFKVPVQIDATTVSLSPHANPIDAFISAKLEEAGLPPNPEADPLTLLRRLHLDLTGLIPTPEEIDRFLTEWETDPTTARHAEVERLLASPHFGERWGRHWLDLARYADSDGYLGDTARTWAWRYRDWVVDSINRDQPYDQFSIEQIAGDLLPDATPEQHIATGFHRNSLRNTEAGVDKELARTTETIDRVNALSTTWLALTLACAECHNHKHDPLKQREFYQIYAFFNNLVDDSPLVPLPGETEAYHEKLATWERGCSAHEAKLKQEEKAQAERQAAWEASLPSLPKGDHWKTIFPQKLSSGASDIMETNAEGIVEVTAKKANPDTVTYTIEAPLPKGLSRIGAIRLEAVGTLGKDRHAGLHAGRGKNGSFTLSNLSAEIRRDGKRVRSLTLATKNQLPWAVTKETRKNHVAVFSLSDPSPPAPGEEIVIILSQKAGKGTSLRRFRLSLAEEAPSQGAELPNSVLAALALAPDKRSAQQKETLLSYHRSIDPAWSKLRSAFDVHIEKKPAAPSSRIQAIAERSEDRLQSFVHIRGEYTRRGEEVAPGVPAVLHPLKVRHKGAEADRLDLAHWLVDEANPLTARVAANQIWQHLFGVGLVETSDDFGTEGATPTHPELLDWLAIEFRKLGWSRKDLIRLIVDSEAYRRSSIIPANSVAEPSDNTLLWRQNRYRIEAEVVRDIHLAASGLLTRKVGGETVYPPLPGFVSGVGRTFPWPESTGEDRYRRGLYIFLKRTVMFPSLVTFDAPGTEVACSRRERTESPMQALTLLNDPVFYECAEALGDQLYANHETSNPATMIDELFRLCLSREPDLAERDVLLSAHNDFAAAGDSKKALTATARVVLNLEEFITRE